MNTHIAGIAVANIAQSPIESLAVEPGQRELVRFLKLDGFQNYAHTADDIATLAADPLRKCISDIGIRPEDIDAILFCTECLWNNDLIQHSTDGKDTFESIRDSLLNATLVELGMCNAHPYVSAFSACSNLVTTLRVARNLIETKEHNNVLVVIAERQMPGTQRIPSNAAYVFSDMALAFLVSDQHRGYQLSHLVSHTSAAMFRTKHSGDTLQQGKELLVALSTFDEKVRHRTGRPLRDHGIVVCDNVSSMMASLVCRGLSIADRELLMPTKADYGHAFSMDGFLSLRKLRLEGKLGAGDVVSLLSVGPWALGLIVVVLP